MRNIPPETALTDALEAISDDLRQTLAGLRRPAELALAEARLTETRERRAESWDAYRAVVAQLSRSLVRDSAGAAAVHAAKADLDKAELEVVRAQRALARLRAARARTIGAAIARHRAAAAAAVSGAADILAEAEAAAAREHIELVDVVEYTPAILGVITMAQRSAVRQRSGADREFAKAAAAMAARAAPFEPPAPTRWTGRLADLVGEGDDWLTPIPIKPGSSTTTQRIPAAIANGAAPAPAAPLRLSAAAVGAVARSILRK